MLISYLNAPLRLSEDGLSLYRLLIFPQLLFVFLISSSSFFKLVLLFILYFFCSIYSIYFSTYLVNSNNFVFYVHYFLLLLNFFTLKVLLDKEGEYGVFSFLRISFFLLLISGVVDFGGVALPNIEHVNYAVRGVLKIENDYSLALVAFVFAAIVYGEKKYIQVFIL
jgi:hypothetical protein